MIATESSWERSRRGDICYLCRSLNFRCDIFTFVKKVVFLIFA